MEDKKGKDSEGVSGEGSAMFNQQQYHVGDFVYVANKEMPGGESKIFLIEKIYRTNPHLSNGVWMMAVNQFFRYILHYHVTTKQKFKCKQKVQFTIYKNVYNQIFF